MAIPGSCSSQTAVSKLYKGIMDDVINSVREPFLDEGLDDHILQELKEIWTLKLSQTKALGDPNETSRGMSAPVLHSSSAFSVVGKQMASASSNKNLKDIQSRFASIPSYIGSPAIVPGAIVIRPGAQLPAGMPHTSLYRKPTHPQNDMEPQSSAFRRAMGKNLPEQSPISLDEIRRGQGLANRGAEGGIIQLDGADGSSDDDEDDDDDFVNVDDDDPKRESHEKQHDERTHQGKPHEPSSLTPNPLLIQAGTAAAAGSLNSRSSGASAEMAEDEEDEEEQGEPSEFVTDAEPLGPDDDISNEDPEDLFDCDNVVVCQYDRVNRAKNRWKFILKDGIMNLNGTDYVFQKATGEAEW